MRVLLICLTAALLAGCADVPKSDTSKPKIVVSERTMSDFGDYKAWLTSVGHGFFAMSIDGKSWAYWGCPSGNCTPGASDRTSALKDCVKASHGIACVIFARNLEIVYPYEVAP
jgi:uncharacterized protein YceK